MSTHVRTIVLVAAAVALAGAAFVHSWTGAPSAACWYWFLACFAGELLWIRLPVDQVTISMASCFNVAAFLVLPRGEAMLAAALASFLAEISAMQKPVLRALFNGAQSALAVGAASMAFARMAGGSNDLVGLMRGFEVLPFLGAAAVYYLVNRGAVSVVVGVSQQISVVEAWRRNFGNRHDLLASGAVFSLGAMVAVSQAWLGLAVTAFTVMPLLLACDSYRRQTAPRQADPEVQDRKAA